MQAALCGAVCAAVLLVPALRAGEAGEGEPLAIYTCVELLRKAERIVVAELAPSPGGGTLTVREVLKAPKKDPHDIDPEMFKRAAALLADDKADLPIPAPKPPAPLTVAADGSVKLPVAGTPAIFFLWERVLPDAGSTGNQVSYRLSHPQCVYDIGSLAQVKQALERPREDGRYLRDWDKQMAGRLRERQAERALLKAAGGEIVQGLRLRANRPVLALKGDHSIHVSALVENTRARELNFYNGPAGGYGAILQKKGAAAETGIILRLAAEKQTFGADASVLKITDQTDFTTLPGQGGLTKELFFDAAQFPALKNLHGEHTIRLFFISAFDGAGAELNAAPWTGTLVSEPVPLQFPEAK